MIPADKITIDGDTAWLVLETCGENGGCAVFPGCLCPFSLDRPCDTCGGPALGLQKSDPRAMDCDCIDGRHTFDIEVETPEAKGFGKFIDAYRVSVVPGMVLRIVDDDDDPRRPVVSIKHGHPYLLNGKTITKLDSLPPAAAPGMWAVKLKVAK